MTPLTGQTADSIIARYVETIGGQDAVEAIESLEYDQVMTHLGPFINYERKGISVQFVGEETVDRVTMYRRSMVWPDGRQWETYFDVASGLFSAFKPNENMMARVHDYR